MKLIPFDDKEGFYDIKNWEFSPNLNKSLRQNLIDAGSIVLNQLKEDVANACVDFEPSSTEIKICLGESLGSLTFDILEAYEGYISEWGKGDKMDECAIQSLDAVILKLTQLRSKVEP